MSLSNPTAPDLTEEEISAYYTKKRNSILNRIREGLVSVSMSNIEYYDKPWDDLTREEKDERIHVDRTYGNYEKIRGEVE
jgi:hypothetical protein